MNWKLSSNPKLIINLDNETFYPIENEEFQKFLNNGGNPISADPEAKKPDWGKFRFSLGGNFAFRRMRLALKSSLDGDEAMQNAVYFTLLESHEWAYLCAYWNTAWYFCPTVSRPNKLETSDWNLLLIECGLDQYVSFLADGQMVETALVSHS
ncbi:MULTISPECIES: hypothetical protein [Cyanophyceae]|uniref:hypothetical protein n=1 Tax=Cyanophyceae TaxID=3028117 RepID=UPI0016886AD9|nr:hypothetical protein [Trichocoleus sp. FACHB-40]MBD2005599.1 hypothetical protein [Trichocoleus sp. FACHB-40]